MRHRNLLALGCFTTPGGVLLPCATAGLRQSDFAVSGPGWVLLNQAPRSADLPVSGR